MNALLLTLALSLVPSLNCEQRIDVVYSMGEASGEVWPEEEWEDTAAAWEALVACEGPLSLYR